MSPARRPSTAARCRCWPQPGNYGHSTTYTILRATGGCQRHLLGRHQQLRLPDAVAVIRRQRRLPDSGAGPDAFCRFGGADAQPARVGVALDQSFANGQRRLRHGAGRDRRPQHRAGPAGAQHDQRPALCRLRHDERQQQRAVHERARPADGQRARRRAARATPGAGRGLRDRELRRARSVERLGQRAGRPGHRAGQQQCQHPHLQLRRRGGRHRLSPRSALPGRPRRRLHPWHAVGEQLPGPGLDRQRQRRGLRQLHARPASMSTRWRATPTSTTSCSARS